MGVAFLKGPEKLKAHGRFFARAIMELSAEGKSFKQTVTLRIPPGVTSGDLKRKMTIAFLHKLRTMAAPA
jgi:hypothetical protein